MSQSPPPNALIAPDGNYWWDGARWQPMPTQPPPSPIHQPAPPTPYQNQVQATWALRPPQPKSKSTAVLLAVFLSFWTWVYTYQKDAGLFWINLVLSVLTVGFWGVLVAWPWAIICAAVRPLEFYDSFPNYPVPVAWPAYSPAPISPPLPPSALPPGPVDRF